MSQRHLYTSTVPLYHESLATLTDLYELTMAQGYWHHHVHETEVCFDLFFRRCPFGGEYALAAGLQYVIDFLSSTRFEESDIDYLQSLVGQDDQPLFNQDFLKYLSTLEWSLTLSAVPEGTIVLPQEPILRVSGPILQCQLLETFALDVINFSTLIATKASRVVQAAQGDPVVEFGLRRAQGIDGGLSASRNAWLGGCDSTSNVAAGKFFGIPVKGTHAHSWVMFFQSELEAFRRYADAFPQNSLLLVDTYDTIQGIQHAITVGQELRQRGAELRGIRLDSGDLTKLSRIARQMLDAASFPQAQILASNELDEYIVRELKRQQAMICIWGVGTKLATAFDQPALGGVYKLVAVREGQYWIPRIKVGEQEHEGQLTKVTNPGVKQIRRYFKSNGTIAGDVLYDETRGGPPQVGDICRGLRNPNQRFIIGSEGVDLLQPVWSNGVPLQEMPTLTDARQCCQDQLKLLPEEVKRFDVPSPLFVGLSPELQRTKDQLLDQMHSPVLGV